jgi:hypothetical protein
MNANSQKCEKFVPLLDAYHDGELDESERLSVDEHLRKCPACSTHLAGVSRLVATLKAIPPVQMREDFADKFEARLFQEKPDSSQKSNVIGARFGFLAASAAALILCVCAGQFFLNHPAAPNQVAAVTLPPVNQVSKKLQAEQLASVPSKDDRAPAANSSTHDGEDDSERKVAPAEKRVPPAEATHKRNSLAGVRTLVAVESAGKTQSAAAGNASAAAPTHSLVAFYEPETNSIPEELGISTDEDGLYAIKM